jgi:hypothetical protein
MGSSAGSEIAVNLESRAVDPMQSDREPLQDMCSLPCREGIHTLTLRCGCEKTARSLETLCSLTYFVGDAAIVFPFHDLALARFGALPP